MVLKLGFIVKQYQNDKHKKNHLVNLNLIILTSK